MGKVVLTRAEAESLADYLWMSFIPFIQERDNEVDNLEYILNITKVWKKCDDAVRRMEGSGDGKTD